MRYRALAVILLAFAMRAEAAQPVAVVLSKPIDASEAKGAKQLASLVQQRLLDAYAQKHGLQPTEAELRPLLRSFGEVDPEGGRLVRLLVQNWKVQRSLFRKYGGRVLISSFGFHVAIDAMKQFLKEEEKRGSFEILDPELRAAFWTAIADESWADGVASGRGAEDVFATAPWQAERRP